MVLSTKMWVMLSLFRCPFFPFFLSCLLFLLLSCFSLVIESKVNPYRIHQVIPIPVHRWHHLCFTYDHQKHVISTYLDGRLNNEQMYDVGSSIQGNGARLGQGTQPQRSFSGDLTQVIYKVSHYCT